MHKFMKTILAVNKIGSMCRYMSPLKLAVITSSLQAVYIPHQHMYLEETDRLKDETDYSYTLYLPLTFVEGG